MTNIISPIIKRYISEHKNMIWNQYWSVNQEDIFRYSLRRSLNNMCLALFFEEDQNLLETQVGNHGNHSLLIFSLSSPLVSTSFCMMALSALWGSSREGSGDSGGWGGGKYKKSWSCFFPFELNSLLRKWDFRNMFYDS